MVTTFKTQADKKGNVSQTSRLSSSDSLSLDSAQFLIEATLNYDFDYNDQYTFLRDSKSYEFASNLNYSSGTSKIKTTELEQAYNVFHDSIVTKIDASNKVSVVDISVGVIAGGTIVFKANPIIQINTNTNPSWNCSTFGGISNGIGYDPSPLEKKLKFCVFTNPYNCFTYFLTNVTTVTYVNAPGSIIPNNGIYRRTGVFGGSTIDLTNIPLTIMANYATYCTTYVNTYAPTSAGIILANLFIEYKFSNQPYYPYDLQDSYRKLNAKFGLPISISAAGC